MRTQVFAHKGYLGILSDFKAEGLFNDPESGGQLGFVVDAAFCDISPEAIDILKKIPKSHDDIGDVDVFKAEDGRVIFAWIGGPQSGIDPKAGVTGSSTYSPELLVPNPNVVAPYDFKEFIDEIIAHPAPKMDF